MSGHSTPSTRTPTEVVILRGTLKMALLTLAAAERARTREATMMLVADAAEGLRIGLGIAPYVAAWLPIETAPKDGGATIDVWIVVTFNGQLANQWRTADVIWDGAAWVSDNDGDILEWKDELGQRARVTHWMPLPASPATEPVCQDAASKTDEHKELP